MALAVKCVYTVRDNKGKTSTTEVKIPTGLSIAEMIEFAQEMAKLIDAVTVGQIINVSVCLGIDLSALGLTAAAGSTADVEEKAKFVYRTAGGFSTQVNIPALSEAKVLAGSDVLDLTDAAILAFNNAMLTGIALPVALTTVQPTDAREDDIVSLTAGYERFMASGRRR